VIRGEVHRPDLDDTRLAVVRRRQDGAEIQVMGDDDCIIRTRVVENFGVIRRRISNAGPVHNLKAYSAKSADKSRRQVHVQQRLHGS